MSLYVYAVAAVSVFMVISSAYVFATKKIMHAVLALTGAFTGSALFFMLMGQELVALLQLFLLVGGLSTYLIVAISTEEVRVSVKNFTSLVVTAVILYGAMAILLPRFLQGSLQSNNFSYVAGQAFESQYAILYFIVALLFAATLGSILMLRRHGRLIT